MLISKHTLTFKVACLIGRYLRIGWLMQARVGTDTETYYRWVLRLP